MSNYLAITFALLSTITLVSCIAVKEAVAETPQAIVTIVHAEIEIISALPQAIVTIVEEEIEIEYIFE